MDRIEKAFSRGREANRALFVAYLCACDPDEETSFEACKALIESGVDVLELGVPFSDPLADGVTNQLAAERALKAGATQDKVFRLVERLRAITEIPLVFYTYYNLIYSFGVDAYVKRAKAAGIDGLLTLDLPPEEAKDLQIACANEGVKTVFIVAPTTPRERIKLITEAATGFIYYVSREGVTGVRTDMAMGIDTAVSQIKEVTDLPVVVGFGISQLDQVRDVAALADGVVVGSALVNCIPDNQGDGAAICAALRKLMDTLTPGLTRD